MDEAELKQACLDISNAALAFFDLIENGGVDAPFNSYDGVLALKNLVDTNEKVRGYYSRRNISRMLALGVSPESLLRMSREE